MKCKNDANYYFANRPLFETKVARQRWFTAIKKGAQTSTFFCISILLLQILSRLYCRIN